MDSGLDGHNLKRHLKVIRGGYEKSEAIAMISGLLDKEYRRLEGMMRHARDEYLDMDADNPAQQNAVADLRLKAVEEYWPVYVIENFLADMGVDVTSLVPEHRGSFELSHRTNGDWSLSVVSLKENSMRTLGGHCNVIGDVIVLEKLLYDYTYLAAVLKLTDDYEPGKESYVEFDFYTVVFDEDIQSIVQVHLSS